MKSVSTKRSEAIKRACKRALLSKQTATRNHLETSRTKRQGARETHEMKLMSVLEFTRALTGVRYHRPDVCLEFVRAAGLEILGEVPNGRGVSMLVDAEKASIYLKERKRIEPDLGSLEARIERMAVQLAGLIRQANLNAERLTALK